MLVLLPLVIGCGSERGKRQDGSGGEVSLTLAFWGDIRSEALANALIEVFHKSHPSIRIKPVFIVGDYRQKLLTMIAGGTAPDVMMMTPKYMIDLAELLGKPFDYIRVDLILVDGQIYFGELTNYTASGTIPYDPVTFDYELGLKWTLVPNYWK